MTLKRKRSDDFLPSSPSSMSSTSSSATTTEPIFAARPTSILSFDFANSNESGRTQKRHRNDRPSESTVHAHTLDLLWDGSHRSHEGSHQTQGNDEAITGEDEEKIEDEDNDNMVLDGPPEKGQRSLNAFWKLSSVQRIPTPRPQEGMHGNAARML